MRSSQPSVEEQLLLAAGRRQSGADWFDAHSPDSVDWNAVIDRAREHGILPLFGLMLSPCAQVVGDRLLAVAQHVRLNQLRNMQLMAELCRLNQLMDQAGVRMLPYKGPALAMMAYGDLSLRQSGDLDLLVSPTDMAVAARVLRDAGYAADKPTNVEQSTAHEHHTGWTHPQRNVMVELHWRVVGGLFSFEPVFEDLWDRGQDLSVGDELLRVMSPEDTMLVLAAHGMKHFWSRLGWICDIAEMMRRYPEMRWADVFSRAKELGGERIVCLAVQLANDVCRADGPTMSRSIRKRSMQLQKRLFARRADEATIPRGMRMEIAGGGKMSSLLFHLGIRERWSDGLRYVMHRMFTPTEMERDWITLPALLRPFYFLVRPVRLAANATHRD